MQERKKCICILIMHVLALCHISGRFPLGCDLICMYDVWSNVDMCKLLFECVQSHDKFTYYLVAIT